MTSALYILQQDNLKNSIRLDSAREVVNKLIETHEAGDPIKDMIGEVYKLQKLLKYTGAWINGKNPHI
jgi:hypothetical protein